ncbi:MAG TPA: hypothetical protein VFP16_01100 [Vicinamibacterales bacterium]|nr:hypothetical protein [Vicinamibacterales bacterium]
MPFPVIARRRYGYYVAPFVTRKNGTLGKRAVGPAAAGAIRSPVRNRPGSQAIRATVANRRRRRSDRARDRFTL